MIHDTMDIFDEMDEMFDRLFEGMHRQAFSGPRRHQERYRIEIRDGDDDGDRAEEAPVNPAAFGPTADVQRIGNEVKVLAGLPGITADSLRLGVRNGTLVIDAGDADTHYHTSALLPPVDPASMTHTLKNGVLEVTFAALPGPSRA